jgi:thymidylate synthase
MLNFLTAIPVRTLRIVNPQGTVAICALWTPVEFQEKRLRELYPELLRDGSPICSIGGLYGGGLKIMLRNLHFNPQVDTVILYGKDFAGAGEHLRKFFRGEIVKTGRFQRYILADGEKRDLETVSIVGRKSVYHMDSLLLPEDFARPPRIWDLNEDPERDKIAALKNFFESYRPLAAPPESRPDKIPLPRPEISVFPTEPKAGAVVADTILGAWEEILYRLHRFGIPVTFRKGKERRELLNFKAVINFPQDYSSEEILQEPYLLNQQTLAEYQNGILNPAAADDGGPYTYGNRIRSHFDVDLLERAAASLAQESDARHALISLWDNGRDLEADESPCLVSLFFRKIEGKIHLTATFRSHNASYAWPLNAFALLTLLEEAVAMAQKKIAARSDPGDPASPAELSVGSLTVISLSLTLNADDLPKTGEIIRARAQRPYRMAEDPNGYFKISVDREKKEIVAQHHAPTSELLTEYRGRDSHEVYQKLATALAVSDLGHAMYLGSQLERAWLCLQKGLEYVQDKKKLF